MGTKIIALLSSFYILTGCASFAHSPFACESVSENLNFYGWAYRLFGNVTQLGDCATSRTLKVELGSYYYYHKQEIDREVTNATAVDEGYELNHFAKAFNCSPEAYEEFHTLLFENKEQIFSDDFTRSPRQVTKSIHSLIATSNTLSKNCK